jgi:hypothetical protein
MTRESDASGNLSEWRSSLQLAGWEAIASQALGEVAARKEQDGAAWSLVLDRARRFKLTVARAIAPESWSEVAIGDRVYGGQHEYRHVLTVAGQLAPEQSIDSLLADLAYLAEAPPAPAGYE